MTADKPVAVPATDTPEAALARAALRDAIDETVWKQDWSAETAERLLRERGYEVRRIQEHRDGYQGRHENREPIHSDRIWGDRPIHSVTAEQADPSPVSSGAREPDSPAAIEQAAEAADREAAGAPDQGVMASETARSAAAGSAALDVERLRRAMFDVVIVRGHPVNRGYPTAYQVAETYARLAGAPSDD